MHTCSGGGARKSDVRGGPIGRVYMEARSWTPPTALGVLSNAKLTVFQGLPL